MSELYIYSGTDTALPSPQKTLSVKKFPPWLKKKIPKTGEKETVERYLRDGTLHTVCDAAGCPNRNECFSRGTATFLIMGDICARNCAFCGITHGAPKPLDPEEPDRIRETVEKLNLSYVVITSVTRDDLADGGAGHFAATIKRLKENNSSIKVEVLIPDFQGSLQSLQKVLEAEPDVLNHNMETVSRLYPDIRPQAEYSRSLKLLKDAGLFDPKPLTKSGIMVGLGETEEEVVGLFQDLRDVGCSVLTIGQYLRPSAANINVKEFVTPEQFEIYGNRALGLGFKSVFSGPFVRSSYRASEIFAGHQPK